MSPAKRPTPQLNTRLREHRGPRFFNLWVSKKSGSKGFAVISLLCCSFFFASLFASYPARRQNTSPPSETDSRTIRLARRVSQLHSTIATRMRSGPRGCPRKRRAPSADFRQWQFTLRQAYRQRSGWQINTATPPAAPMEV